MREIYCEPFVLYEIGISALELQFSDRSTLDVTPTLKNGRSSYILFENLVGHFSGLLSGSQGGLSDLVNESGLGYEVKSYRDPQHVKPGSDFFHTAASSTFGPNNQGPRINNLLFEGNYAEALDACKASGYSKNGFYVYTNTSDYLPTMPFRYFIVPTPSVLECLSTADPRRVSRSKLLGLMQRTQRIK